MSGARRALIPPSLHQRFERRAKGLAIRHGQCKRMQALSERGITGEQSGQRGSCSMFILRPVVEQAEPQQLPAFILGPVLQRRIDALAKGQRIGEPFMRAGANGLSGATAHRAFQDQPQQGFAMRKPALGGHLTNEAWRQFGGETGTTAKIAEYHLSHQSLAHNVLCRRQIGSGHGPHQRVDVGRSRERVQHGEDTGGPARIAAVGLDEFFLVLETPARQMKPASASSNTA